MKLKTVFCLLILACVLAGCQPSPNLSPSNEPPLRNDPPEQIIADLETFIPARMQQADIPGLTVALIQDGQVVWSQGFGVTSTFNRQPLQPDAVFEVASLSKVATAYAALQMTAAGQVSLDEPVNPSLPLSWQIQPPYGSKITLRHLLSHSSGAFNPGQPKPPPGQSFFYTGFNYARVQRLLQSQSGLSLEELATRYTFEPLGMSSTSYNSPKHLQSRLAYGHIRASYPLLRFLLPASGFFICLMAALLILCKWRTKKWCCPPIAWGAAVFLATIASLLILAYLYRWSIPKMGWLIALTALVFEAMLGLLLLAGLAMRKHLPPAWQTSRRRMAALSAWVLFSMAALTAISGLVTIPTPHRPARFPSAAASLWSNAADLAALMIEISQPQYLPEELASQMCSVQTVINPDISWGLGIGIQHSDQGDSLWHTGVHFDFTTLAVIYPDTGNGIVLLTNTNQETALREIAQRALGGKAAWEIPREVQSSSLMPEKNNP